AVHLGDLLRIWVRTGTKITLSPSDFQGPTEAHRTPKRRGAFTRTASLSPDEPIPGTRKSYKEKNNSSPGSSVDVSEFGCVTALGPEGPISVSGLGNINPIPFRSAARQTEHVFAFRQTSRFGTDFSDPLGPTDPCSTAVHMEPFSSFSPQGSHLSICYYTKICTGGGSRRAHARHLQRTPPRPSYSLRRKPPRGKLCRSGPDLHQSFFWPVLSGHSSPSFGSQVCVKSPIPQVERGGSPVRPAREGKGDPQAADLRRPYFISPPGALFHYSMHHCSGVTPALSTLIYSK
ncbi:hypothetical protein JTE90_023709, partial [Oedothorax gibbosus]